MASFVWLDVPNTTLQMEHALLVIAFWFSIAAWEISRKIRLPEDEIDYQTYSMFLGWRNATLLALFFTAASSGLLLYILLKFDLHYIYVILFSIVSAIVNGRYLQMLLFPSSKRSELRSFSEMFILMSNAGFVGCVIIQFSIKMVL